MVVVGHGMRTGAHLASFRGVSRNALYKCTILTYLLYPLVYDCTFNITHHTVQCS